MCENLSHVGHGVSTGSTEKGFRVLTLTSFPVFSVDSRCSPCNWFLRRGAFDFCVSPAQIIDLRNLFTAPHLPPPVASMNPFASGFIPLLMLLTSSFICNDPFPPLGPESPAALIVKLKLVLISSAATPA